MRSEMTWRLALLASAWLGFACGTPMTSEDPCGDHGELHGDHCHCDTGYTERDGVCVVKPVDACGPHGENHDDHCDCDAGYVERGGTCVLREVDAGVPDAGRDPCAPNGEQHGNHCHCDVGFEEVGGTCVVVVVDAGVDRCAPHGEQHGNHCHCDAGYEEVGGTCVVVVVDAGVDPCAPNGELHGNHCHCDTGYVESGLSCVPVMVVACGNGHRHGSTCVCYADFRYSATTDTCEAVVPPTNQPPLHFVIVALGEDGTSSGMNALNDSRHVTGNKRPTGQTYLSAYTQEVVGSQGTFTAGNITDVGILANSSNNFSRPWDINTHGVIVGESGNNNPVLPFIYTQSGGLLPLSLPAGSTSAAAHGINDTGQLVGIGNSRAISWASSLAVPTYLPSHVGATVTTSRAWKLNEAGDIVGHARDAMGLQRATWWKPDGSLVDLGSLNVAHASEALDVNASRQIVGKSFIGVVPGSTSGTLQAQAFIYESGSMRGLGLLSSAPNALHSLANAINDDGWVVGQVEQIAGLPLRAVLWRDGVIVDLNDLLPQGSGWVLTSAVDINSHGDIVGRGTLNGSVRPFMLVRTN